MTISNNSVIKGKGKDDFEEIRTLKHKMTNKFNVGDKVKYTGTYSSRLLNTIGIINTVDTGRYYMQPNAVVGYFVVWNDGESSWLSGCNLSLVEESEEPTIKSAKELKAELELKIVGLIREFNKKTNLEVQDIDLKYWPVLNGECFYLVNVKVEI